MSDLCPLAVRKVSVEDEYQPPTIGGSLHLLLMQKKYCDVTFTFPNLPDRIEAHEFILKARSPVFAKIFQLRKSGNVQGNEIEISECTPERFHHFLEFIYTDHLGVDMTGALDLLQMSHKYKVHPLAKKCEEVLKTQVPVLDSPRVFEAARRHGLPELMDRAGRIMMKSFMNLVSIGELFKAGEETVVYLLERDDLIVEEVQLFQFILDWGNSKFRTTAHAQTLKDKLKNVIPKIRFTNMTLSEFTNVVVPTGLLSAEETLSVYSYFGGDAVTRAGLNLKFNTARRKAGKEVKFVDFFAEQEYFERRWAPAFSEQRLLFKVATKEWSGCPRKTAVITKIKFQWPGTRDKYFQDEVPSFNVTIKESATGSASNKHLKVKFRKSLDNCIEGVRDEIAVKPPVELMSGHMYAVIVENESTVVLDKKFQNDARAYYGHVFSNKERTAGGDFFDNANLDLKEIRIRTDYYADRFSSWDFYFAVIKGITIELV